VQTPWKGSINRNTFSAQPAATQAFERVRDHDAAMPFPALIALGSRF
jgi:hypothetical protein